MSNLDSTIHFQRLKHICEQSSAAVIVQAILGIVISQILISAGLSERWTYTWLAALSSILLIRFINANKFLKLSRQNTDIPVSDLTLYTHAQSIIIFIVGVVWAVAIAKLISLGEGKYIYGYQMMSVAFTVGIIGVGVGVLSSIPRIFYLFSVPLAGTLLFCLYTYGDSEFHYYIIIGVILGFVFFSSSSRKFSQNFDENIIQNITIKNREMELINRLGMASEFRDTDTWNHINRMSHSCYLLALEIGFSKEKAELLRIASSLHDIGKIGISDSILLKPGKLTLEERNEIKKHAEIGAKILADSDSEMIQLARSIAENHHERMDGKGYPHGLKGEQIPIEARIAAICDVYDALTSGRPYKKAWSNEKALAYIIEHSGSHFDSALVQSFMNIYPEITSYAEDHKG